MYRCHCSCQRLRTMRVFFAEIRRGVRSQIDKAISLKCLSFCPSRAGNLVKVCGKGWGKLEKNNKCLAWQIYIRRRASRVAICLLSHFSEGEIWGLSPALNKVCHVAPPCKYWNSVFRALTKQFSRCAHLSRSLSLFSFRSGVSIWRPSSAAKLRMRMSSQFRAKYGWVI